MVTVEILDPTTKKWQSSIQTTATKLCKHLTLGDFYLSRNISKKTIYQNFSVEIFLVGDEIMKKNVLSYCNKDNFPRPDLKTPYLGEIYLNPLYIQKNKENIKYMLLHGFLHLLGYDHKKKNDKMSMEEKEAELKKLIS